MIPVDPADRRPTEYFLHISAAKLQHDYFPRLEKALSVIPEEKMWEADGESTNSVGNILLHMSGNLRQWIIAGVGHVHDDRHRAEEFSTTGGKGKQELLEMLAMNTREACGIMLKVSEEDLLLTRNVQAYEVTGLEAVYHAVEHFSYHLGQVIHIAKRISGKDLRLYSF